MVPRPVGLERNQFFPTEALVVHGIPTEALVVHGIDNFPYHQGTDTNTNNEQDRIPSEFRSLLVGAFSPG